MLMKLLMLVNFFKKKINKTLINIGSNTEMTIKEYANFIKKN